MSENKYRDYLSNDRFHHRYLKNEDEPVGASSFLKFTAGVGAAVGVAAGTAAAYKRGHFRAPMQQLISQLGSFRKGRISDTMQGIRNWANDEMWEDQGNNLMDKLANTMYRTQRLGEHVQEANVAGEFRRIANASKPLVDEESMFVRQLQNIKALEGKRNASAVEQRLDGADLAAFNRQTQVFKKQAMEDFYRKLMNVTNDGQKAMEDRIGYRQATVGDTRHLLPTKEQDFITGMEEEFRKVFKGFNNFNNKVIDPDVFVKAGSKNGDADRFADIRDFKNIMQDFSDSIAEDFSIPFIKINPFRMFYLNEFTKRDMRPSFAVLQKEELQPWITRQPGNAGAALQEDMLYSNGRVYKYNESNNNLEMVNGKDGKPLVYNLIDAKSGGPLSTYGRKMAGLELSEFEAPTEGFFRKANYHIQKKLDIGFQDDGSRHNTEVGDPMSIFTWAFDKIHNGFGPWGGTKPYGAVTRKPISEVYGKRTEYVALPAYRSYEESGNAGDYFKQFFASRKSMEDVNQSSFFTYAFAERLNATLNQMNIGLSTQNLGSAQQILGQLMLRRVAPVVGAVQGWQYFNYEYEKLTGDELEDQALQVFGGAQVAAASVRDKLGITQVAKDLVDTMPGFDFLAELPIPIITTEGITPIPIKDLMPFNKTEQELLHDYRNGEEAVRKGRYWEFGNTPLTGSKVDYFQPHWFRRLTSDWEYTETMWGSKDEYWANHWAPTLSHPFAPVRHFITDTYHWEKKHYEDRPYMMTGGIPELENMPLVGPLLNATIGQILKPQRVMHEEEWKNPNAYKETDGYALAYAYGLTESTMAVGNSVPNTGSVPIISSSAGGTGGGVGAAPQGMFPIVTPGSYSEKAMYAGVAREPLAYTTPSGRVQVMKRTGSEPVGMINYQLQEEGIGKTGQAVAVRMQDYEFASPEEELVNPAILNMTMGDLHYNMTEMGGFYGWASTIPTNKRENQYKPEIQTSSKAYGYERAFWDNDLGNIGADGMEIFRRFIPRDEHKNYTNVIDNNMPTWMPGADYFINFQTGDPYTKVKKGEMRLAGHSYEKMYGIDSEKIDRMEIGASLIGYDKKKIVDHWLHRDDVMSDMMEEVTDRGTKWHKQWEAQMAERGIALELEQYVKDEESQIGGFFDMYSDHDKALEWLRSQAVEFTYYQATAPGQGNDQEGFYNRVDVSAMDPEAQEQIFQHLLAKSPRTLVDPKTRTTERFDNDKMHFENVQQVNFYASQKQTEVNYLIHVDAENPERGIKVFAFDFNPYLLEHTKAKVHEARGEVRQMLKDGAIGRGDLYGPVDRYRILADTAPYSDEFRSLKSQLSKMGLSDTEKEEIREINDQLSKRHEAVRTYDYRFKTANVTQSSVTVKEIVDNNTFLVEEFDNPVRLAGVYVPTGKDDPIAHAAGELIRQNVKVGEKVRITVNADEENMIKNDTYRTVQAVVNRGGIQNLNRELIQRGLAKEKEEDYSPAAIHARFSPGQINWGKTWETVAHMDTPFHTKLLQVRSPLEQYERREVYGKNWQDWANPIEDYAIPWYQNWISGGVTVGGLALGTFMGSLFGQARGSHARFGRTIGALIGFTATALGMGYVEGYELLSGKAWVPDRREKERNVEEYFDKLKFVKNRALYEQFAERAKREENFNVKDYLEGKTDKGGYNKYEKNQLGKVKRALYANKKGAEDDAKKLVGKQENKEAYMKAINAKLNEIANDRKVSELTPLAAQAIQYYNASEQTMYGYDAGDPLNNLLMGLPNKDKEYMQKFLEAPEEERKRILEVVPDYMKPALQSAWGMKADKKESLESYFQSHHLPDKDWVGWDPRASLDDIKVKFVKREGLDPSEFNMWMEDEQRAEQIKDSVVPMSNISSRASTVKQKLHDILGETGLQNLRVDVTPTSAPGVSMDIDVQQDRRNDVVEYLNANGRSFLS